MKQPLHVVHEAVVAAAVAPGSADPHTPAQLGPTLDLTPEQKKLIATLAFLTEYQVAHLRKVGADVALAFDDSTLAAIDGNVELGGKVRGDRVRANLDLHAKLTAIATVVGPLAKLIGQNLLSADGQLAVDAGEVMKVARGLEHTKPALKPQVAALEKWTLAHHGRAVPQAPAPAAK